MMEKLHRTSKTNFDIVIEVNDHCRIGNSRKVQKS